jgi:hypothetical protein
VKHHNIFAINYNLIFLDEQAVNQAEVTEEDLLATMPYGMFKTYFDVNKISTI